MTRNAAVPPLGGSDGTGRAAGDHYEPGSADQTLPEIPGQLDLTDQIRDPEWFHNCTACGLTVPSDFAVCWACGTAQGPTC